MKKSTVFLGIFLLLLTHTGLFAQNKKDRSGQINWSAFMAKQSLKWDSLSTNYYTGIILGNGLLGANVYKKDDQTIRFDIGRTDVVDQRVGLSTTTSGLYNTPRLPIGFFSLQTEGKITGSKLELDIYNAVLKGNVTTTKGSITVFCYVPSNQNVVYFKLGKTGGEKVEALKWNPGKSISPRFLQGHVTDKPKDFFENPAAETKNIQQYTVCNQPMLNKGGYTTAYKTSFEKGVLTVISSVGYDKFSGKDETEEAINNIKTFEEQKPEVRLTEHQNWWNTFYQKSFVTIPDKRIENFYWIQLYKMASATRPDKPMMDLMGPWTADTPWPAIWWNLNAQLAYSPIYTSNHLEIGESLFKALDNHTQNLINNAPEKWRSDAATIGRSSTYDLIRPISETEIASGKFESANLVWTMHNYYQYYAYSLDSSRLATKIYPLLKRAANFMVHLLVKDEKGIYHFVKSSSPEYKDAEDANYSLASLKWALTTLIDINRAHKLNDPDALRYQEIVKNLVSFPTDDTGYLIGKDVALTSSHRHYSHLMMIHPYYLVNWDQEKNRDLISKSVNHWMSMKGGLAGFSFTGSAAMYASMNDGDKALEQINALMNRFIQPNTLYRESGPVIESSLACSASIQDMLLQSWGDKIRVFPAIPADWKNIAFKDLLAEGAYQVSAIYENGATKEVQIRSLKGGFCRVLVKIADAKITSNVASVSDIITTEKPEGTVFMFDMKPNEIVTIKSKEKAVFPSSGVSYQQNPNWSWGLNKNNTNKNAN
ncbi:glycosyl hydrolase family 95 catalytic domain-containing protein [Pedobacter sp. MW01-1-1]|uniref:glycosyl hydrolase family 95 catalytic domain-containing protein n=1 Tax=Pedobacter sp. MW01-1-1 TaxID=3383027 RepID=UPI003FEE6669